MPGLGIRSYLNKPQLPYFRLPGFESVEKNDIVVFSWPADTVRIFFKKEQGVKKPIDKKSNYVKRCVGTPGDSLEVRNGYVYINGEQLVLHDRANPMYDYTIYAKGGVSSRLLRSVGVDEFTRKYLSGPLSRDQFNAISKYLMGANQNDKGEIELYTKASGIPPEAIRATGLSLREETGRQRDATMTAEMVEKVKADNRIDSVVIKLEAPGETGFNIFPQDPRYTWNNDHFGPIYLPRAGDQVELNVDVLPLYKKIIRDYEKNTVSVSGNQVVINGNPASTYTFKQDYYWMMGDNRHHSEDSRTWGYVPADHIVGKPVFIWLSFDNFNDGITSWKPRWKRIFTTVGGKGEPRSYLIPFLVVIGIWIVYAQIRKRRKQKAA